MNDEIFEILDREFLGELENKDTLSDKKYFIGISAIPQAGITTLAKMIEERFSAVRIEKNKARIIIYKNAEIKDTQEVEDILHKYLDKRDDSLFKLPNKLIVWDGGIDRNYRKYQEWATRYGYNTFVVNLETDRSIIEDRIKKNKDKSTAKWYLATMYEWQKNHNNYIKTGQIDFTIKNNSESDLIELFKKLDILLK